MIKLLLIILFFSTCIHIRVLSFTISSEANDYYNVTINEIDGLDQNWINMKNVENNANLTISNSSNVVISLEQDFELTNVCSCFKLIYKDIEMKFNNLYLFSDHICINSTTFKKYHVTGAITEFSKLLSTPFRDQSNENKSELDNFKITFQNMRSYESNEIFHSDLNVILKSIEFYKNLDSKFFKLRENEYLFGGDYFYKILKNLNVGLQEGCQLQTSNSSALLNLGLGKFSLIPFNSDYCFKISYAIPIFCNKKNLFENLFSFINSKITEKKIILQKIEDFKKETCGLIIENIKEKFFNFKNILEIECN